MYKAQLIDKAESEVPKYKVKKPKRLKSKSVKSKLEIKALLKRRIWIIGYTKITSGPSYWIQYNRFELSIDFDEKNFNLHIFFKLDCNFEKVSRNKTETTRLLFDS